MVTVDTLKHYLLIPDELTEEDMLIKMLIETATVYAKHAINYFDLLYEGCEYENEDFIHQADMFILLRASELYQNRNAYSVTNGDAAEPTYITKSLMLQLQTYPDPRLKEND